MPKVGREWAGGRAPMPAFVMEEEPFRPEVILWCERPHGHIVGNDIVDPRAPISFAESLSAAMAKPLVGPPRRPPRVRVASADLAAEIRAAHSGIDVVVAPTPEIDDVLSAMARSMRADRNESYLEGGRIPETAVARLFHAAEILWNVAPWKSASDDQVLRVDLPALGVDGACLSIIGALGESMGFILFPSLEGYEAFLAASERDPRGALDLGSGFLSFDFERETRLPASLRREVARHGWPVACPDAYPRLRRVERDGVVAPLAEKDLRVVAAVAGSLAAFCIKHGHGFWEQEAERESICESWHDQDDLEVRFTFPYEAFPTFDVGSSLRAPVAPMGPKVGRNAPCPCGSGKKFKKCCLPKEETRRVDPRARCHELDERLVEEMLRFARRRFGEGWGQLIGDFLAADQAFQLAVPWSVYGLGVAGRPIVEWFLEKPGRTLSLEERAWLEAQRRAWLGIWEVVAVEPGRGVTVVELLSGEERRVEEVSGSKLMARRDTVLGRVVDHEGISVFCGMHSRPLPPLAAAEVLESARSGLRKMSDIPLERLREEGFARRLIERWEDAVAELDERRRTPPALSNTDGDAILFTVDHFTFDPERRVNVVAEIASLEGVERSDEGDERDVVTFVGPGKGVLQSPIIGQLRLLSGTMRLETNSLRRADDLRRRIEAACGTLVRHRAREHSDPRALLDRGDVAPPAEAAIPAEVKVRLVREFKERHYAAWLDQPLPALDGKTPREAARTKASRNRLDVLLKEMENHEARLPEAERFDFSPTRRDLGLPP